MGFPGDSLCQLPPTVLPFIFRKGLQQCSSDLYLFTWEGKMLKPKQTTLDYLSLFSLGFMVDLTTALVSVWINFSAISQYCWQLHHYCPGWRTLGHYLSVLFFFLPCVILFTQKAKTLEKKTNKQNTFSDISVRHDKKE